MLDIQKNYEISSMARINDYPAEQIQSMKAYSLSNDDINAILSPDTNILTYNELSGLNSIDDALDSLGRCILLCPVMSENSGHWVCLWKEGSILHYFDPYGYKPEEFRKWVKPRTKLFGMGAGEETLMRLLRESPYEVVWNNVAYQKDRKDINSCGRHCIVRLLLKDYTAKEYADLVRMSRLSADDFVTIVTMEILGK